LCLLSQCDYRGYIDAVPALLAAKIGVSEEVLMSCIADFMAPDPGSRTGDKEGRRLELIDPSRGWGWRVINVKKYRDKASGQEQVLDGRNAAKVARYKERKEAASDTAGHRQTPTHTQTHTQTQTPNQRASKTLRETVTEKIPQFSALVDKFQS
jgi:hypothetical protein